MSKAIVVLNEMPKSCMACNLSSMCGSWCSIIGDTYTKVGDKSDDCPLKPLPQKIEELSIEETIISNKYNSTILLEKAIKKAKQRGYNECLDEILGEEE